MKRTYCDGCSKELIGQKIRAMEVEHTFPNGRTFRVQVGPFGTSMNHPGGLIIMNDGDLCDECALAVVQEGFPVTELKP